MIFAKHNYYSNFCNASGADDHDMKRDMVLTEITKIIADQADDFKKAINDGGGMWPKTNDVTPEVLADTFIANLSNKKFQRNLAVLVLDNHNIPETALLKLASPTAEAPTSTANSLMAKQNNALVADGKQSNTNIVDATASVIDTIAQNANTPEAKKELKNQILSGIISERKIPKITFGKVVLFVGIVGVSIWAYNKYFKTK